MLHSRFVSTLKCEERLRRRADVCHLDRTRFCERSECSCSGFAQEHIHGEPPCETLKVKRKRHSTAFEGSVILRRSGLDEHFAVMKSDTKTAAVLGLEFLELGQCLENFLGRIEIRFVGLPVGEHV